MPQAKESQSTKNARVPIKQLASFTSVGAAGFVVDAGIFLLLTEISHWSIGWSRTFSVLCAITVTWTLNRHYTFADRKSANAPREYMRYALVQAGGVLVNLGLFSVCLMTVPWMRRYPIIALAIGATAALGFNFYTSKTYVFLQQRQRRAQ